MSLKELCVDSLSKTNKNINYIKDLMGFEETCKEIEIKRKEYYEFFIRIVCLLGISLSNTNIKST